MITFLKVLAVTLASLLAPLVTLVYRGGWFNTPDDTVAPRGLGNAKMRRINAKFGTYLSDWWWLGVRNKAFGLAYALKPAVFKRITYPALRSVTSRVTKGRVRTTEILGYRETAVDFGLFHVLYGYRLTPIYNEIVRNTGNTSLTWDVPHRAVNMDARPIFSIRSGAPD